MSEEPDRLEHCTITVEDGKASAHYRWVGAQCDGYDSHDKDVSEWKDREIIELFCDLVGISHPEDIELIQLNRF